MKKKKALNKDSTSWLVMTISILFIVLTPLLIRITAVTYPMDQFSWYPNETNFYDIYSLVKSNFIIIIGIISALLLVYRSFKYKNLNFKDPVIITTIIFSIVILFSHLTSINTYVSSHGFLERYENTWVWISYLVTFLLLYTFEWKEKHLKLLIKTFVISNVFLSILGILQFFGTDLLLNDFFRPIITSLNMQHLNFSTEYITDYKTIYQTLYHYNYVGFYISMSFPIMLSLFLHEKKMSIKIFLGILVVMIGFNLLGSTARGGLVGIVFSLPLFIFLNRKKLIQNTRFVIIALIALIIVFVGFESYTDNFVTKRILSIFTSVDTPNKLQSITTENDQIKIIFEGNEFIVDISNKETSEFQIKYHLNGSTIQSIGYDANNKSIFDNPELSGIKTYFSEHKGEKVLSIDILNSTWHFGFYDNKLLYLNPFGNYEQIENAKAIGFEGREKLGSSRGYIWSRTIPLIFERPLLGFGVDTFALAFPQNDYVGKYNAYNTNNMIVDKAHNIYLNIAINSGVISLIAYIMYFILFAKKLYSEKNRTEFQTLCLNTIAVALTSYFIASFFNDSSVMVSPVFWGIIAIGLGINKSST